VEVRMQATYGISKVYMGRLSKGSDLYNGLFEVIKTKEVGMGIVYGIGALERLVAAYYDQKAKEYRRMEIEEPVEVLSLTGNISLKDGLPFLHAHIVVANELRAMGGHLLEGSRVFAFEYQILELEGPRLNRAYDDETGLFLWADK